MLPQAWDLGPGFHAAQQERWRKRRTATEAVTTRRKIWGLFPEDQFLPEDND